MASAPPAAESSHRPAQSSLRSVLPPPVLAEVSAPPAAESNLRPARHPSLDVGLAPLLILERNDGQRPAFRGE